MPDPSGWSPAALSELTGVAEVDALLSGIQWASPRISFSFPGPDAFWSTDPETGYGPQDGQQEPWLGGYRGLFPEDREATRLALAAWAAVADLEFVEIAESETAVGDLRFAYGPDALAEGAQAYAYLPNEAAFAGDVWFNVEGSSFQNAWDPGSYEFLTAIHEIGHALGLKHPFERGELNPTTLSPDLDSRSLTVMSYSAMPGSEATFFSFEPTTPMVLDIVAMQAMYGPNMRHAAGNDVYRFEEGSTYHLTIWDAGGRDTLVHASRQPGFIDLNAASGSLLGEPVFILDEAGNPTEQVRNVWIALEVVIENASGGSAGDEILGNAAGNLLQGNGGNDTLSGAAGNDRLDGGSGNDTLSGGPGSDTLRGGAGTDTLVGGGGADRFTFDTPLGASPGRDTIGDFSRGQGDRIVLDDDVFSAFSAGTRITEAQILIGAGLTRAQDADDRLIFNTSTGALFYDADGRSDNGAAAIQIAVLTGVAQIAAGDFLVVT